MPPCVTATAVKMAIIGLFYAAVEKWSGREPGFDCRASPQLGNCTNQSYVEKK